MGPGSAAHRYALRCVRGTREMRICLLVVIASLRSL